MVLLSLHSTKSNKRLPRDVSKIVCPEELNEIAIALCNTSYALEGDICSVTNDLDAAALLVAIYATHFNVGLG